MHLRLENFDGPLDLLLYLIKAQELNIFNIPIAYITEQFLGLIKQIPKLDFQMAGEYLATAAQLIEIKANMLIPILQNKEQESNSLEEIAPEDPRKPLVEQLLEFESLKKASEFLAVCGEMQEQIIPSGESKRREEEFAQFEHPIKGNPFDLIIALEKILLKVSSQKLTPRVSIRAQKITIQDKMIFIKKRLFDVEFLTLLDFVIDCVSRYDLIVTIMAILELCKANQLVLTQVVALGEITILKGRDFNKETVFSEVEEAR